MGDSTTWDTGRTVDAHYRYNEGCKAVLYYWLRNS